MKNFDKNCHREGDGFIVFSGDDELKISKDFPIEEWNSVETFNENGILGYEPMTAKELDTVEKQDLAMSYGADSYIEEKFDGTRALLYFFEDCCRVFSRRISKKTGFYVENSDSLPQLKHMVCKELNGTIIDGEMFIDGRPFKDVASTMNCLWDKAIDRQIEKGFITLHAFDIIKYKGVDVRRMPLEKRKKYLERVVKKANNKYLVSVPYYSCSEAGFLIDAKGNEIQYADLEGKRQKFSVKPGVYPYLDRAIQSNRLTPRAYYELIVASGGEGVIVKPKNGKYLHKRGWEYGKIKKFLTRELIICRFDLPTREYTGKFPNDHWDYWEKDGECIYNDEGIINSSAKALLKTGYTPVTRHYYKGQVGNLVLGVLIHEDDYRIIDPKKRGEVIAADEFFHYTWEKDGMHFLNSREWYVMEICECGGFDDETRAYFSDNEESLVGSVVEVRANEIMQDSGRMRHPRYMRMREDKNANECTWENHMI